MVLLLYTLVFTSFCFKVYAQEDAAEGEDVQDVVEEEEEGVVEDEDEGGEAEEEVEAVTVRTTNYLFIRGLFHIESK